MSNQIHVALAYDQNYLTPFYVLITSIFDNNKNNDIELHVIATGVDEQEKVKILEYVRKNNSRINFYEIDSRDLEGFSLPKDKHFTVATYYRLFFPKLLRGRVNNLIYIDIDTVVVGDLATLYSIDLGRFAAGAAIEWEWERPGLGLNRGEYFNAGILLINIPEWISQRISEKAIEFILQNPEKLKWADQDALNVVLAGNYHSIDNIYNVCHRDIPNELPRSQYESFLKGKVIIHYCGTHKPWHALGKNKLRFVYHRYLRQSPHAHEKKYNDVRMSLPFYLKFLKIRVDEFLLDYPKIKNVFDRAVAVKGAPNK